MCANHGGNPSESNCERCGIFMCSLCRTDVDELVICPGCFDRLSAEGALASTVTKYRDYSRMAVMSAAVGVFLWFTAPLLGPLAIVFGVRALKQQREFGDPEARRRAWLAIVVGVAETAVGVWLVFLLLRS